MRRPPCFLWEGRAEELQGTTTRCVGWVPPVVQWWTEASRSGDPRRVPGTADVCGDDAGRTTPRMRKALPMGRAHTKRAWVCLGWFHPANRVGACRNLRQGSGVHTHRQVVAGPVCRGIVMCAAINAMLRQPALLLQFGGAVTAAGSDGPIGLTSPPQWSELCSSRRFPRSCWQHSAVGQAPDDLPMGSDGVFSMRLI